MPPAMENTVKTSILEQFYSFLSIKDIAQICGVNVTTVPRLWRKEGLNIQDRPKEIITEKKCTQCSKLFPLNDEFYYTCEYHKDGYKSECKICFNKKVKKYQKNNPEKRKVIQKRYTIVSSDKAKRKQKVYEEKHYVKRHYQNYVNNSKKKGRSFELNFDMFVSLCSQCCYYCSYVNGKLNDLDRIDSSKGYTLDNVVPACKDCNFAKQALTQEGFLSLVKRIYEHHSLQSVTPL